MQKKNVKCCEKLCGYVPPCTSHMIFDMLISMRLLPWPEESPGEAQHVADSQAKNWFRS